MQPTRRRLPDNSAVGIVGGIFRVVPSWPFLHEKLRAMPAEMRDGLVLVEA